MLIINEINIAQPKTKEAAAWLKNMNLDSALIVDSRENNNLFLAVRNIPKVKAVDDEKLNTYDVLRYKWLVFSQQAFNSLVERLK